MFHLNLGGVVIYSSCYIVCWLYEGHILLETIMICFNIGIDRCAC